MAVYVGECPNCGGQVQLDADAEVGEIAECADCGGELEVTSLKPVTLKEAPEEEEDWGE